MNIFVSGNNFSGYGGENSSWSQGGPQGWNNVWGNQRSWSSNNGGNICYEKVLFYLYLYFILFKGGSWRGGNQNEFGGGPMRGNFGSNRAVPYHTGRSNIFCYNFFISLFFNYLNVNWEIFFSRR